MKQQLNSSVMLPPDMQVVEDIIEEMKSKTKEEPTAQPAYKSLPSDMQVVEDIIAEGRNRRNESNSQKKQWEEERKLLQEQIIKLTVENQGLKNLITELKFDKERLFKLLNKQ